MRSLISLILLPYCVDAFTLTTKHWNDVQYKLLQPQQHPHEHRRKMSVICDTTKTTLYNSIRTGSDHENSDMTENGHYLSTAATTTSNSSTRRSILQLLVKSLSTGTVLSTSAAAVSSLSLLSLSKPANAAVGTLPEYADTNAVLQGLTIDVVDLSQQDSMIAFLQGGFNFRVLRQKRVGSVTDTWLGYGPEQLSIPNDFEIPVSSFNMYGGHASIHLRYDSKSTDVLYNKGENAPGDNIAFLQVAVPEYRISQMVKNGGNILDAYGIVDVVSPSGLPIRGIIGIAPDPLMFVAIQCQDVKQSRAFYEQLGFTQQEYPYARPSKGLGQFEPPQPKNSVYLAPSANSMGVLLIQSKKKKKSIRPNPVLRSLNVVYTPSEGDSSTSIDASASTLRVEDPSLVPISFISSPLFEKEEQMTRVQTDAVNQ